MLVGLSAAQCFFHYTTRDASFGDILPRCRLRLSTYERMRDPFENKDWPWIGSWPIDGRSDPAVMDRAFTQFNHIARGIRQQAHLLAFTVDGGNYGPERSEFAKGWSRARMWDQYAEGHAGVCLVFDKDLLIESVELDLKRQLGFGPYHGPVRYSETGFDDSALDLDIRNLPSNIDEAFVTQYIEQKHRSLFFEKLIDWESEREYRFVTTAPPSEPLYASFDDALLAVIVGEKFPDWQRPSAIEACRQVNADA